MPELRIDRDGGSTRCSPRRRPRRGNLFAFPAQSNFSGVKHPLELVEQAHAKGWDVLLDAAAFVPTNRLDLSQVQPDFVVVSFYKMFGYPTGVGLPARAGPTLPKLRRPWFAGGTVNFATVQGRRTSWRPREAGFEDGTLNYLSIPAVEIGLRHLERIGIDTIHTRVRCLTGWLLEQLLALRHGNGRPMVRIYGPATTDDARRHDHVQLLRSGRPPARLPPGRGAGERRRASRCAPAASAIPGAGETAEGLTEDDMLAGVAGGADMTLPRFLQIIQHRGGKSAGAIRVSLGLASNFADVDAFRAVRSELPRPDAADDRRGDLRHRILPRHPRRLVVELLGTEELRNLGT